MQECVLNTSDACRSVYLIPESLQNLQAREERGLHLMLSGVNRSLGKYFALPYMNKVMESAVQGGHRNQVMGVRAAAQRLAS